MNYERFTKRAENGKPYFDGCLSCDLESDCGLCSYFESGINRLAELEDKMEQGTLIELPCKVGDTVYLVHRDKPIIECWTVTQFSVEEAGLWLHIRNEKLLSAVIHSKSRGVCFTREEAEKRLKELQNG